MRCARHVFGAVILAAASVVCLAQEAEPEAATWIFCVSDPPGARILMGHPMSEANWEKGVAPLRVPIHEAGPEPRDIRVTLAKPGYEPYTTTVAVKAGDEIRVVGNLSPRRMMSYVSDAKLVIANADGSEPTDVAALEQPVSPEAPAWFPDSRSLCVWQAGSLVRMTPDGKALATLADPAAVARALGLRQPVSLSTAQVLADGRWVVFLARWGGRSSAALIAPTEAPGLPEPLLPDVVGLRVSPSEGLVVALTNSGAELLRIGEGGSAEPVRSAPRAIDAAWSDDGEQLALAVDGEVYVGDRLLSDLAQLTNSDGAGPSELLWTPDGAQIVCTIHREVSRRDSWDELWLLCAPGHMGDPQLLLDGRTHPNSSDLSALAFVPYSARLAYRSGQRSYAIDLATPGDDKLMLFNSGFPSWSLPTTEVLGPQPGEDRPPVLPGILGIDDPELAGPGGAGR